MIKNLVGTFLAGILFLSALTYVALELDGVLSVETVNTANGEIRKTHIWYVKRAENIYLEAGNPGNPWVIDIESNPEVNLTGESVDGSYVLEIDRDHSEHKRIRRMMREKYGWRDHWVAMIFDTSKSKLIRAHRK